MRFGDCVDRVKNVSKLCLEDSSNYLFVSATQLKNVKYFLKWTKNRPWNKDQPQKVFSWLLFTWNWFYDFSQLPGRSSCVKCKCLCGSHTQSIRLLYLWICTAVLQPLTPCPHLHLKPQEFGLQFGLWQIRLSLTVCSHACKAHTQACTRTRKTVFLGQAQRFHASLTSSILCGCMWA